MAPDLRPLRVLAVSSGGGHWVQLSRLLPAFAGHDVSIATVHVDHARVPEGTGLFQINDATRWNKIGLVRLLVRMAWILVRLRPQLVISTGAAPGYLALRLGKLIGARTIWVDSMANVERLSMSGERVRRYADLWLTQWPHLAAPDGPFYHGSVL